MLEIVLFERTVQSVFGAICGCSEEDFTVFFGPAFPRCSHKVTGWCDGKTVCENPQYGLEDYDYDSDRSYYPDEYDEGGCCNDGWD